MAHDFPKRSTGEKYNIEQTTALKINVESCPINKSQVSSALRERAFIGETSWALKIDSACQTVATFITTDRVALPRGGQFDY